MKRIEIPQLNKILETRRDASKRIPTPLHEFVFRARKELNETATKGDGSFGFYFGILKRIPLSELESMLKTAKQAKDPLKSFWWHIGEYKRQTK